MAAIVGSIWSRSALNMRRVSVVVSPPEMNSDTTTSSKEVMKDVTLAGERARAHVRGSRENILRLLQAKSDYQGFFAKAS